MSMLLWQSCQGQKVSTKLSDFTFTRFLPEEFGSSTISQLFRKRLIMIDIAFYHGEIFYVRETIRP